MDVILKTQSILISQLDKAQHLSLNDIVDLNQPSFWISCASIIFNPLVWNIVARNEYRKHSLTKTLGSPYYACYLMAISIFLCGLLRDGLFEQALRAQPQTIPDTPALKITAGSIFAIGQLLVLSSTWALGITGTYLGDYCGLLQDKMVEGFPFNVRKDPMYEGSTLCFIATALWYRRPAGLIISVLVWIVYQVALRFEGPFTSEIYAKRERERSSSSMSSDTTAASADTSAKPISSSTATSIAVPPMTPKRTSARKSKATAAGAFTPSAAGDSYAEVASAVDSDGTEVPKRITRSRSQKLQ